MKVEKIDHVAISVKDLDKAIEFFGDLLGTEFSEPREIAELDMRSSLDPLGIELVAASTPDGVMAKAIERRGEGLSMMSFKVPDLEEAIAEMQSRGVRLIQRIKGPKRQAALFHPKDSFGVLIEFVEYKSKHPIVSLNLEK